MSMESDTVEVMMMFVVKCSLINFVLSTLSVTSRSSVKNLCIQVHRNAI